MHWNSIDETAHNKEFGKMPASEHILIDISLLSYSLGWTNITELWNISSAIYLYPATVRAEVTRNIGTSPSSDVRHNTMRLLLITISTLAVLNSLAQVGQVKVFRKTEYLNGDFFRQVNDTIRVANEHIDIYFFKRHFYSPYYLPEMFVDERHKNRKISIWRDSKNKKGHQQNWENTYTYDSLGRVTNYTFSGCIICSNLPYSYTVIYNLNGHVEQIFNTISLKDSFKFYYNSNSDITKFEKYLVDKLETKVELVN